MDYETKKQIVFELRSLGKSLTEISKKVSLSSSTVQYFLKPKAKKHGVKLGRPRKINAKEKKFIREAVRRFKANDKRVSAQKFKCHGAKCFF